MKKMILIAALIGGMLMPAQMMAQKRDRRGPKVEYRQNRRNDRKEIRMGKPGKPKYKPAYKPQPAVVVVNRPVPRPCPPPPPPPPAPRRYYYDNDVLDAATAIISFATLAAILAD